MSKTLYEILETSIILAGDSGADALVVLNVTGDQATLDLYIGEDGDGNYSREVDATQSVADDADLSAILEQAENLLDERLEVGE